MSTTDEMEDSSAPLIEHLAELRNRLIHSVVAFLIGMIICFTVATPIFNFLTNPLCSVLAERGQDCDLIFISPQEGFFVAIKVSLLGGFILSFPYIGLQMWRFVAPGLYKNEKGAFLPFMIASPFMFLLGASFAFFVVTPLAYDFFLGFQQFGGQGEAVPRFRPRISEPDHQVHRGLWPMFPIASALDLDGQGGSCQRRRFEICP